MKSVLVSSVTATAVALATVGLTCGAAQAAAPVQLAQNNNTGPNLFALYQQIQQLQQQVRDLNGQVDTLEYKLKQQEQGQRDLYKNLDKRISTLENSGASGSSTAGDVAGATDASTANVDPAIQSAYMDGFNKLKAGQYDQAVTAFKQFVSDHPDTPLTANAWYWLGEASYVQQDLDQSQNAFETVVNRFKASPRIPAALYKIGLIESAQGHDDDARATFQRVVDDYPDSDVASQAKSKLGNAAGS